MNKKKLMRMKKEDLIDLFNKINKTSNDNYNTAIALDAEQIDELNKKIQELKTDNRNELREKSQQIDALDAKLIYEKGNTHTIEVKYHARQAIQPQLPSMILQLLQEYERFGIQESLYCPTSGNYLGTNASSPQAVKEILHALKLVRIHYKDYK